MIFSNKYIDYSSKTKKELYQTLILFLILSNRTIVYVGKRILQISLILRLPIFGLIKNTVFKHFCGGENIVSSKKTILNLLNTLDFQPTIILSTNYNTFNLL